MVRSPFVLGLVAIATLVACGASSYEDDEDTSEGAYSGRGERRPPQPMLDRDGKPLGGVTRTNCDIFLLRTNVFCENDTDDRATCKDVFTGTIDVRGNLEARAVGVRFRVGVYETDFPSSGYEPGNWGSYVDLRGRPVAGGPRGYQRYDFRSEPLVTFEGPVVGIGGHGYDSLHIDLFPYADTAEGRLYDAVSIDTPGRQVSFTGNYPAYEAYTGTLFNARDDENYCSR